MSNDLGFALAGVAGAWSAAVAVLVLSIQGHGAGVFSRGMRIFGTIVAFVLILAPLFIPIIALLAWALIAAIAWIRHPAPVAGPHPREAVRSGA